MRTEPGLRELKKRRTRRRIADVALALFAERGFDRVPVAEVARRAEVSEATVFNYFRTKEDLIYGGMTAFGDTLLTALRTRPPGQPVLAAFRAVMLGPHGLLDAAAPADQERIATIARLISTSPSLRARERQAYDDYARSVAMLLAEETGDDVQPWAVAHALVGTHRALIHYARTQLLSGQGGPTLPHRVRAQAARTLTLLDAGLRTYGARP